MSYKPSLLVEPKRRDVYEGPAGFLFSSERKGFPASPW